MRLTLLEKKEPELYIPEEIYNRMLANVRSTTLEITFMLEIIRNENDRTKFKVNNFFLPPQWNEPAESKTLDSKYPQWCLEKVKQKIKLNGQGHTHPKMSVTPSGYDVAFFKDLIKETNTFQMRLIMNQEGLIQCDLVDKEQGYVAEDLNVIVECKGFKLVINNKDIKIIITNTEQLTVVDISNKLEITVMSELITANKNSISESKIDDTLIIKTKRRYETDEAITYGNRTTPSISKNNQNKTKIYDDYDADAYEEFMKYYEMERGFYGD